MIDEKAEPWRYNFFIANNYWHDAPNIAARFWDADPKCDFALLASVWHSKNDFGRKLDPVFSVQNIIEASRKSGFEVGDVARVIHATYLGYLADRERQKTEPIIILPPPPTPSAEKPKLPEIRLPQVVKPRPEWVVKASVWMTVLTPVMLVISYFIPPPWNLVAKAVLEVIKFLVGG